MNITSKIPLFITILLENDMMSCCDYLWRKCILGVHLFFFHGKIVRLNIRMNIANK